MAAKKNKAAISRSTPRITITEYEGVKEPPVYPIPRQAWLRGLKLMRRFGADEACYIIDERAWRCFDRGDDNGAIRWRNLIVAIHAIDRDEPLWNESKN